MTKQLCKLISHRWHSVATDLHIDWLTTLASLKWHHQYWQHLDWWQHRWIAHTCWHYLFWNFRLKYCYGSPCWFVIKQEHVESPFSIGRCGSRTGPLLGWCNSNYATWGRNNKIVHSWTKFRIFYIYIVLLVNPFWSDAAHLHMLPLAYINMDLNCAWVSLNWRLFQCKQDFGS